MTGAETDRSGKEDDDTLVVKIWAMAMAANLYLDGTIRSINLTKTSAASHRHHQVAFACYVPYPLHTKHLVFTSTN